MRKGTGHRVTLTIPITEYPKSLGGFHRDFCTVESEAGKVVISSGYGLGNPYLYVAVNGKRVLAVDTTPILEFLAGRAIELADS